ncbi:UNVERIFIED_CONTAM: hypothetical protein Sradi_3393700 [Sesamum radiatum]|uniref:Late embryogenesis abundant protein LEA-2 subgroup domain-containing protein n=1 Tax=Sesamum radiatum TaxID=300843 RepID=A0AAW2R3W5_SESRA
MADDFGAENLEDGELWLPSDFFSMDEVQWYGASGGAGGGTHDPCGCGTGNGNSWAGWSSIYQLQRLNPVQTQVGNFFGERAWALQSQQQHHHRFGQNRVFPGVRMGAHGGTGVFLPRISSDMLAATVTKNHNHHCFGKGQRLMKSHELQLPPRKILLNRRQEECCGYFAAERERKISHHMGFPSGPPPDDPEQKVVMGYPSIDRHHQAQQMYPEAPPAYPGPSHPAPQPPPQPPQMYPQASPAYPGPSHPLAYTSSSFQAHSQHSYASSSFERPPDYDPSQFQQDAKYPIPSGYEPSQFQHEAKYMIPPGYDPSQFQHNTRYPVSSGYDPSQFQHNGQYPIPSAYGPPQCQFPHDPKLPIPGPQNPYPQPYNDYYYQQPYKPLGPQEDRSSFGKVMLMMMIVLIGGMCMMSLVMWFLFGTNIPEFEVTSLKVSNFSVMDSNLTGEWNVDVTVHNANRELAIHFATITSSIFYKEILLGVSSLRPFQVEKTEKADINFSLSALNDAKMQALVLPQLAEDQSKGTVLFSLILSMKANFTTPTMIYRQDSLKVLCENMPVSFWNGEGKLLEGWRSRCLIHMHDGVMVHIILLNSDAKNQLRKRIKPKETTSNQ